MILQSAFQKMKREKEGIMLDLYEIKQFVAFARLKTLSKVAEEFHISTPSVTRSMQHLEESFGVPLFSRGKNKIELNENGEVLEALEDGSCDIGILPFPVENSDRFMEEHLFVCVPPEHELASHETLTFADINGFNFLLRTELGFWDTLCREKMPASKFLVQTDVAAFDELVNASSLPCFSTDYGQHTHVSYAGRVNIPLTDAQANVTFYVVKKCKGK